MPGPTPDGDLLSGRYQLVRQLGRGAMGIVWEARDVMLDRTVAVKMMDARLADDTFRQRFHNEAASLAKIRSRQIVTVYDYGQVGDDLFLVTELIPDGDLQQRLRDRGAFDPVTALTVARQVCEGLADAHGVGVIHRDVKPANVLLWDHPQGLRAYVCDFGIAAGDGHQLTQTGAVVGSAAFMAPERHWGHPADRSSDLYSLGCLLWATLTGVAPYMGTDYQVINAHIYAPPPRFRPESATAQAINSLLDGLLAKKPTQRWADAAQVTEHLAAALEVAEAEAATHPGLRLVPTPDLAAYGDSGTDGFGGLAGSDPGQPAPDLTAVGRTTKRSTDTPLPDGAARPAPRFSPRPVPPSVPPSVPGSGAHPARAVPTAAPRRRRRGLVVAAAVGAVLLIGGGATAVALSSSGGSGPAASTPPDPTQPAPGSSAPTSGSPSTSPSSVSITAKPDPKVVSGYRAVSFTVAPGPHDESLEWRASRASAWKPVTRSALTVSTSMGDQKACASFRYVGPNGSSAGPSVQRCGRSQRPTIDFVRTSHRCTSPAYDGYDCWYYDVVATGFRSGSSPRALVFLPDGSRFCDCVFHRIDIGKDGRGRQDGTAGKPGEWQVPSTIRRVVVEIDGVRQTVEL